MSDLSKSEVLNALKINSMELDKTIEYLNQNVLASNESNKENDESSNDMDISELDDKLKPINNENCESDEESDEEIKGCRSKKIKYYFESSFNETDDEDEEILSDEEMDEDKESDEDDLDELPGYENGALNDDELEMLPEYGEEMVFSLDQSKNSDQCFICLDGGTLIFCDKCSNWYCLECLKLNETPKDKIWIIMNIIHYNLIWI